MTEFSCLDKKATQSGFARMVGCSQQAIAEHVGKALRPGETFSQWLKTYCEHLRISAAGRGGEEQKSLTLARIDEARVKAANGRLQYNKDLGQLVLTSESEAVLSEWATQANQEFNNAFEKLVHEIESTHSIEVDDDMVMKIAGTATERISSYATKLGEGLVTGGEDLCAAQAGADA